MQLASVWSRTEVLMQACVVFGCPQRGSYAGLCLDDRRGPYAGLRSAQSRSNAALGSMPYLVVLGNAGLHESMGHTKMKYSHRPCLY